MKKLKFLKFISSLFLIFSLSLMLFSCQPPKNIDSTVDESIDNDTDNDTDTDTESTKVTSINLSDYDNVKDYKIIETENGYRLIFDDPLLYSKGIPPYVVGFNINSWEEFSKDLLNGHLSYNMKRNMYYTCPKDDAGFIILNPYASYKVSHTLPYNIDPRGTFTGGAFDIALTCEEYYEEMVFVRILEPYVYKNAYDSNFAGIDWEEKKIEYEKKLSDQTTMECYNKTIETNKNLKTVKYILSNGTKTVFVEKTYYDYDYPNIPHGIHLLGNIDGKYFEVFNVFEAPQILQHEVTEDLSDEFLFGFNIEIVENKS